MATLTRYVTRANGRSNNCVDIMTPCQGHLDYDETTAATMKFYRDVWTIDPASNADDEDHHRFRHFLLDRFLSCLPASAGSTASDQNGRINQPEMQKSGSEPGTKPRRPNSPQVAPCASEYGCGCGYSISVTRPLMTGCLL